MCNERASVGSRVILAFLVGVTTLLTLSAQAQTYRIIHSFTGGRIGYPQAGLTIDARGNLYGTSFSGSPNGTVFTLVRSGPAWILKPLYNFAGGDDGAGTWSPVVFGPDGSLYGTTIAGGGSSCQQQGYSGCGTVFKLSPPATACRTALCLWSETVLYRFSGGADGSLPYAGVVFDQAGNLYGTTFLGGTQQENCGEGGCGVVYELSPSSGGWTESVLYGFAGGSNGAHPYYDVVFDNAGNLYGTTNSSPFINSYGTVFQLAPSGSGWTKTTLHSFQGGSDGVLPFGGLIVDQSGNLYGTTNEGGTYGGGTVFDLAFDGNWQYNILYNFNLYGQPQGSLTMDSTGNLYGTMTEGMNGWGSIFKLTPTHDGWTYTSLHDFTGQSDDGGFPEGGVVFDANGNLYGRTFYGGTYGYGVIFEITP